jgi:hypothetical protein
VPPEKTGGTQPAQGYGTSFGTKTQSRDLRMDGGNGSENLKNSKNLLLF